MVNEPARDLPPGGALPLATGTAPGLAASLRLLHDAEGYRAELDVHERGADGVWRHRRRRRTRWIAAPFARPPRAAGRPIAFLTEAWSDGFANGAVYAIAGQLDAEAVRLVAETDDGAWTFAAGEDTGAFVVVVRLGRSAECKLSAVDRDGAVAQSIGHDPWRYRDARLATRTTTIERAPADVADRHLGLLEHRDAVRRRELALRGDGAVVWCRTALVVTWPDGRREDLGGSCSSPAWIEWAAGAPDLTEVWLDAEDELLAEDREHLGRAGVRGADDVFRAPLRPEVDPALARALAGAGPPG